MFEIFKNYFGYEDNDVITANLTEEQLSALHLLESGVNVFLTGGAGTGKSYLINVFRKLNQRKNILVTAPTGVAPFTFCAATP
ncbi:MAG: AAA family ATPase, partial [Succinivibrio dextrinosolvens]|nr:AAA family ATPase [Succinivibrio dextrinosolvens]